MWRFAACVTLLPLLACGQAPPADGRLHLRGPGVVRHPPDPAFPEQGRYVLAGERRVYGCHYRGDSLDLPPAARGAPRFAEHEVEEDRLQCRLLLAWTTAPVPEPAAPGPGERTGSATWTTTFPAAPDAPGGRRDSAP